MDNKVCKHYVKGKCTKGEECPFLHQDGICKFYFFSTCNQGDKCKFSHAHTMSITPISKNNALSITRRNKNTESFTPKHQLPDIRIIISNPLSQTHCQLLTERDVVIVPNLFCDVCDFTIYNNLLNEMKVCEEDGGGKLWKSWHGDTHLIADDHKKWKEKCDTFNMIINRITKYFHMTAAATRFNWYRNSNEWKPYHHDAAAIKPHIAAQQNLTIGVSFGVERSISFQHGKNKAIVDIPLSNGAVYGFMNKVNVQWKHGVPQLPPEQKHQEGRISIIVWGWHS